MCHINKISRSKLCLCLSLLLFSFFSSAQTNNNWYLSKILNDNNGLPQNSVGSMYFDTTTNFLWLATQAGLVRYDGANTKVFDLRDLPSLKTIRISHLFPTVTGEVLVSNTSHEVFPIKNNLPINKAGYTSYFNYYNTNAKSLAYLNFEAKIAKRYRDQFSPLDYSAWVNDSTWIGLSKNHIGVFNNEQLLHYWPTKKNVTALIVRKGFIYALNKDASGYCINLNNKTLLNTTQTDNVLRRGKPVFFYNKLNDQPLLLDKDSLYEISFNKNIISAKLVAILKNLPSDITSVIMHPNKKFVFVSTNTSGVHIYRLSPFRIYKSLANDDNKISSDLNNNYATVLTDSNHIFTSHSLLFDLTTGSSKKVIPSNGYFRNLGLDSSKNVWLPSGSVVGRFHIQEPGKINRYPIKNGNIPITFYLAKSGKFWVSTGKFLGYDDHKNVRELISYGTDGDSSSFFYLAETMDGRLVGANQRGIFLINTVTKKLTRVLSVDQVSEVRNIHVDSSDVVWITTYGKGIFLYKLKENKLFKLPVDDKGYLLYSHAVIEDGSNNLLVPTNKGLFRLSRNNLLHICATPSTPLLYQYFDVTDGLLTNEFNGGCQPAFNRLPDNDIILPSLQGLVRVKVNELPDPSPYPLFIDAVETKRKKYKPEANIHFQKDERTQTWYVSSALWGEPNSQNIFYRTDNDTSWQRLAPGERKIQLNELTGGNHLLEIKNQYGLLQNQFSSLHFKFYITKRYYETVWFWLSMMVLLGIIIYLFIRFRIMQLKRNNKRLQGIIKENTKDLFDKNTELEETLLDLNEALKGLRENGIFKNRLIGLLGHDMLVPLRFIANISEHLYNDTDKFNFESARESCGEIKTTAAQLLYLGESLIQWIKLEEGTFRLLIRNININELANEIIMVHKPMAAVKKNSFICDIPDRLLCAHDPTFIKVILHNLLLNANKFTSGGTITIQAVVSEKFLTIHVQDTGIGMEPSIIAALNDLTPVDSQNGTDKETGWGMGYMLIIDLLRFANGKLLVESCIGTGTKVSFSLPFY